MFQQSFWQNKKAYWMKIFTSNIINKGSISKIYKQIIELNMYMCVCIYIYKTKQLNQKMGRRLV